MIKYKIDLYNKLSNYNPKSDIIYLAMSKKSYEKLSNDELIKITSDIITHEHIHRVLFNLFNITICKLFDIISHLFRNYELDVKLNYDGLVTWHEAINKYGFNWFKEHYHINDNDIISSNYICNKRGEK